MLPALRQTALERSGIGEPDEREQEDQRAAPVQEGSHTRPGIEHDHRRAIVAAIGQLLTADRNEEEQDDEKPPAADRAQVNR